MWLDYLSGLSLPCRSFQDDPPNRDQGMGSKAKIRSSILFTIEVRWRVWGWDISACRQVAVSISARKCPANCQTMVHLFRAVAKMTDSANLSAHTNQQGQGICQHSTRQTGTERVLLAIQRKNSCQVFNAFFLNFPDWMHAALQPKEVDASRISSRKNAFIGTNDGNSA